MEGIPENDANAMLLAELQKMAASITLTGERSGEKLLVEVKGMAGSKQPWIKLLNTDMNVVGNFVVEVSDGIAEMQNAIVNGPYRGCGIGSAIYTMVDQALVKLDRRLVSSKGLNPNGARFWLKFRPDDATLQTRLLAQLDAWDKSGYLKQFEEMQRRQGLYEKGENLSEDEVREHPGIRQQKRE